MYNWPHGALKYCPTVRSGTMHQVHTFQTSTCHFTGSMLDNRKSITLYIFCNHAEPISQVTLSVSTAEYYHLPVDKEGGTLRDKKLLGVLKNGTPLATRLRCLTAVNLLVCSTIYIKCRYRWGMGPVHLPETI